MATDSPRFPEPDFGTSADLRNFCNQTRRACHEAAMALHIGAAEMAASLETIGQETGLLSKMIRKRRAKRVARHMEHAAELIAQAGAASVRTWAIFRAEYQTELTPNNVRGKRPTMKVVPE